MTSKKSDVELREAEWRRGVGEREDTEEPQRRLQAIRHRRSR